MKRINFLLVGLLILCAGCQDDFAEPDLDTAFAKKNAKYEKVKTHHIKGWVHIIPDDDAPRFPCMPLESGVDMCSYGWLNGHANILGDMVQEQSTYEKLYCELQMTPGGPVIYNEVRADILWENGERTTVLGYVWVDYTTGQVYGHTDYESGTGRFEGISGTLTILNGKALPEGGLIWETEGDLTLVIK